MTKTLERLSKAEVWLAEAKTLEEFKEIHDVAAAAEAYAKAKGLGNQMEGHALELRMVAARRYAELVPPIPNVGGPKRKEVAPNSGATIPQQRLSEWRQLSKVSENALRTAIRRLAGSEDTRLSWSGAYHLATSGTTKRPPKPPSAVTDPVFSAVSGQNADLLLPILQLYLPDGGRIADPTWGEGAFWSKVDRRRYKVSATDIAEKAGAQKADFRSLPYQDASFDGVVFDPPYKLTGTPQEKDRYGNERGGWRVVEGYYSEGMTEATRILKPGGILIVKCMDQVVSGKQVWFHRIVFGIAEGLGLMGLDFFVLVRPNATPQPHQRQIHAWKNHSYFWVFLK